MLYVKDGSTGRSIYETEDINHVYDKFDAKDWLSFRFILRTISISTDGNYILILMSGNHWHTINLTPEERILLQGKVWKSWECPSKKDSYCKRRNQACVCCKSLNFQHTLNAQILHTTCNKGLAFPEDTLRCVPMYGVIIWALFLHEGLKLFWY